MTEDFVSVEFSFLAAGPTFRFDLPASFDPVPSLSAPIFNGVGGRSFDFVPSSRDPGIRDGSVKVMTVADRDGRTVEVFQRPGTSVPLWWLQWSLENGSIYSHLREEDGLGMATTEIPCVSVEERATKSGAPYLFLNPPLKLDLSGSPGYQDHADFIPADGTINSVVSFHRPSFVAPGSVLQLPRETVNEQVILRAGTDIGLEVDVQIGSDYDATRAILDKVLSTLSIA